MFVKPGLINSTHRLIEPGRHTTSVAEFTCGGVAEFKLTDYLRKLLIANHPVLSCWRGHPTNHRAMSTRTAWTKPLTCAKNVCLSSSFHSPRPGARRPPLLGGRWRQGRQPPRIQQPAHWIRFVTDRQQTSALKAACRHFASPKNLSIFFPARCESR